MKKYLLILLLSFCGSQTWANDITILNTGDLLFLVDSPLSNKLYDNLSDPGTVYGKEDIYDDGYVSCDKRMCSFTLGHLNFGLYGHVARELSRELSSSSETFVGSAVICSSPDSCEIQLWRSRL